MSDTQTITDAPTHAVNLRVHSDIRALIDQALVRVDEETYQHFLDVLDYPPGGLGFERLIAAPKPWNA